MVTLVALVLCYMFGLAAARDGYYENNRRLSKAIVEALQDPRFDEELLFDLKKENQVYLNRTMSLIIKYIVKREVDNYRSRRTDAISRRIYSSLIMKLIDIAKKKGLAQASEQRSHNLQETSELSHTIVSQVVSNKYNVSNYINNINLDLPRNTSATNRINTAHRYYMSVESRDMHDKMADIQVFHVFARLYDIMYTAPRILAQLGPLDDLTPKSLLRNLLEMDVKPVHLGVALLIQYHLRSTVNYALRSRAIEVLATKPEAVGPQVIEILKALAARLLPVAELLDVHLAHSSPAFKDTCPTTWLGIVNNKQP